jgi:hypothetical protein
MKVQTHSRVLVMTVGQVMFATTMLMIVPMIPAITVHV